MGKKAIIVGASGLIGSNLLQLLLTGDAYNQVLIIARKKVEVAHTKLKQLVINLDTLDEHSAEITGDVIFSCLGTTKAQTPEEADYRKIDHDYPVKLAQIGAANGATQFHLVSVVSADVNSSTFYLKLKGETERDVAKTGIPSIYIYQPSMLKGRKEKTRFGESVINGLMTIVNPLLLGDWKKFHSIAGAGVAKAMYNQSIDNEAGTFIYQYNDIIILK